MSDEKETDIKSYHSNNGKWTGFVLLIIGGFLLSQRLGFPLPVQLFNWQTFLIALGFFIGIRHRFHGPGWLILILIGGFFYADDYYPGITIHQYIWPIILIGVGLIFIIRPRHSNRNKYFNNWDKWRQKRQQWEQRFSDTYSSDEDFIDVTSIFGGTTKNILSKDFKGGDIVSFFGGSEINLGQADITGKVIMDLTQIFGGTKLIVPPHWNVRAELVSIFGGIDDKRPLDASVVDPNKVLVLKGTSIFGGIEIRSY